MVCYQILPIELTGKKVLMEHDIMATLKQLFLQQVLQILLVTQMMTGHMHLEHQEMLIQQL